MAKQIESPFPKELKTRPLSKEESDVQARLNRLVEKRYTLEKELGEASIKQAEAQLEISRIHAALHQLGYEIANIKMEKPEDA